MATYDKGSNMDEEFEPFCQWRRGQERDILEVHLKGFKREHLRVQMNNGHILTISGEQSVEDYKIRRFRKEIKVSKDCTPDQIRAKFASGILYITLPMRKTAFRLRDGMLRMEMTRKMALSVALVVAVGGFLIWKSTSIPVPLVY
ncbi:inactive protein RESTRICTED TEV MOVEMENT 2 isoform X2 [Morus notabilis]|nr:inactive protein RESTRICTED TEV MOVEMENT 2 isoform X2 [Morus notabilis]